MNKNKAISDIARLHKDWIKYVIKNSMSNSQHAYAEDFVQNLYVKLLESKSFCDVKIYDNKKQINKKYVFKTLRCLMIDDVKKLKIKTDKIIENIIVINPEVITHSEKEAIVTKMKSTINKMPKADKNIMNLYLYELPSIRKLSKELNKAKNTISIKLNKCKNIIKKEVYEYRQTA
tara:strand:+ start:319 stop:846 length:528 start_codon:yes stop_codon:yes gene_type:complete